jgi:glucosamine-6-phosphate deaminase
MTIDKIDKQRAENRIDGSVYEPEVKVTKNFDVEAADIVVRLLQQKPDASLILPTGSTPRGMYRMLQEASRLGIFSMEQATIFNLDEYLTPSEHPGSYYQYMKRNLFSNLHTPEPSWHIPNGIAQDPYREAGEYEEKITTHVEQNGLIDLAILGIGPAGASKMHIGFNEPGSESHPESKTRVVELSEATIEVNKMQFEGKGEFPTQAITMGVGTILNNSSRILVLAKGPGKSRGATSMLLGEISWENPASLIRLHPKVAVLMDMDVGSYYTMSMSPW